MDIGTEKEVLQQAFAALEKHTGVQGGQYRQKGKRVPETPCQLTLHLPRESQPRNYRVAVKKHLNNAIIGEAARQTATSGEKFVLVADYVSQPQAHQLRALEVSFFDTAGNAYFNEPGLYVFVCGQKKEVTKERIPRLFRPPGMKVMYAFLTQPGLEKESYRRISAATNVPTPTVGVFMADLEKAGYLVRRNATNRYLVRQPELFQRFVAHYGESFRPTLQPVWFRSRKHEGRWWEQVALAHYSAYWGGETGGAKLTGHLKPETATIYADSLLPQLQAQYGLVRDKGGDVEILRKFWVGEAHGDTAPPLVVYADLVATADRRNLATARLIYEQHLANLAESAA